MELKLQLSGFASGRISFFSIALIRILAMTLLLSGLWNLGNSSHSLGLYSKLNPNLLLTGFSFEIAIGLLCLLRPKIGLIILPIVFALYSTVSLYWWGINQDRCPCLGPLSPGTLAMSIADFLISGLLAMISYRILADNNAKCIGLSAFILALICNSTIGTAVFLGKSRYITEYLEVTAIEYQSGLVAVGGHNSIINLRFTNRGNEPLNNLKIKPSCGCTSVVLPDAASYVLPGEQFTFIAKIDSTPGVVGESEETYEFVVFSGDRLIEEKTVDLPIIASVNRKTAVGEDVMTIEWAIRPGWVEPSPADGVTLHVTDSYTNASMRYRVEFPTASHRHVSLVGSGSHLGRYKIQDASHPVFNLATANACIHARAVIRRVQIRNGDFQLVDMLADVNESETSSIGVTPSSPLGFKIVEYGERVGTPGFRNATITVTLGVDDAVFEERLTVTWIRYQ